MSAPPDGRSNSPRMSANQEQPRAEQQPSNVRVIPIVVEGRDEPVINKSVDHGTHFGETKPTYVPPTQPHVEREYFDDGPMGYNAPPNFGRAFGAPYGKFRQGPQPFVHQKVYPQSASAFGRAGSPQRSQSPKPSHPVHPPEEHFVKVPVHHEQPSPRSEPPPAPRPHPKSPQQQQQQPPPPPQQWQQTPPPQQRQQTPPPQPKPQQPSPSDPITQILAIQTDVLNLMTDVENFKGTKKDKNYLYLDEMLTRNLIKLDNIETDGKENIRLARKEAIKCIQKCIAVLEAKADGKSLTTPQPQEEVQSEENTEKNAAQEIEMTETSEQKVTENGEVEMAEPSKEEVKVESHGQSIQDQKPQEQIAVQPSEHKEAPPQVADTRPEENTPENIETKTNNTEDRPDQKDEKVKTSSKKGAKNVKKRDKSKDNKDVQKGSNVSDKDGIKTEDKVENKEENLEAMQVDDKGDKTGQAMEVDASQ